MISVYKLPDSFGVHGRAGVCRSEFRACCALLCVCVLALVSSDTRYHLTSGPTRHSLRCKLEEFCRREKEAVRQKSHNGSSRGHNHEGGRLGQRCTGKNHTKRWHEHLTKVIATCLCWWLMGGSAALFDKATIHETDEMAECIVNADVPEAEEIEEAQEADEFEEAGNAEGAEEAEQAEEEGVPLARRVQRVVFMWFCGYFKLQLCECGLSFRRSCVAFGNFTVDDAVREARQHLNGRT